MNPLAVILVSLLCISAAAQEVKRADLVGTWQSEERGPGWRHSQHVSIITRSADGSYQIKNYLVDHDLKVFYLRDEWKGTWTLEGGQYTEADPDAKFVGDKAKCELQAGKLIFTRLRGEGLDIHTVKDVDTPSKDGKLTFSATYRDVKSESGWEEAWKAGVTPRRNEESEQDGAGQPATRSESKSEGSDKPQPESEGRSR